jgi:hypothetical protein
MTWSGAYEAALRSIFQSLDPFDAPLSPRVACRALLYPVGYLLDRSQFEALFIAAQSVGDREICLSLAESPVPQASREATHWLIDSWDFEEYRELSGVGVLENVLYSPHAKWGMLISQEQHAVVGGDQAFVDALNRSFPSFQSSIQEFMAFWRDNHMRFGTEAGWLGPLLDHLYGPDRRREMLGSVPPRGS